MHHVSMRGAGLAVARQACSCTQELHCCTHHILDVKERKKDRNSKPWARLQGAAGYYAQRASAGHVLARVAACRGASPAGPGASQSTRPSSCGRRAGTMTPAALQAMRGRRV